MFSQAVRLRDLFLLSLFVLPSALSLQAQRLPGGVHPEHYSLALTPDLKAATFTGEETIDVVLEQPSQSVTLNAVEIAFDHVEAAGQKAEVSLDAEKEQATFRFARPLPSGKVTLRIGYRGILNDKLRGFYLSRTKARNYAVTQFEPTDARRAYPSFDEPALKATYDIALTIDAGDNAISNTQVISDKPSVAGKHTVTFATTPKMSTYLVAFLVGDFQCTMGKADGVPIRACSTPDKVGMTRFAVESAEYVLRYYNRYFGIRYPMPKLDMVALPDFEAGAMENFGCITYRETDLLVDAKNGPVPAKKRVAIVVAHEMAHQWFGDMVTMQWWDNLWLNEGFATWMESKPVAKWKPEWGFPEDDANELDKTLNLDAQATTRTIRAKAETPEEINEMFDGIAYGKSGAVLGMIEHSLGEEVFRQGVHNYLAAHLYANATAEDFWNAQTETSHQPVDVMMKSFVTQPGVPLLRFATATGVEYPVEQSRFFLANTKGESTVQQWSLPVCVKGDGTAECHLLSPNDRAVSATGTRGFFFANAGARGYYRTGYTTEQLKAIVAHAEARLTAPERIGLVGDQWALVQADDGPVGDFLSLVEGLKTDPSGVLINSVYDKLRWIDGHLATEEDRALLNKALQREFGPVYAAMGTPRRGDSFEKQNLRAELMGLLGLANDPAVLTESKAIAEKAFAGGVQKGDLDPMITDKAITIAAANGDAALYEKVLAVSRSSSDPGEKTDALRTLAWFRNPELVKRTMDYAVSGEVRNQDSWIPISMLLSDVATREQTWSYIRSHWEQVHAQLTTNSGAHIVKEAGNFCSVEKRDEVASFFATHKVDATERTLAKTLDSINDCTELRKVQEPALHRWLEAQTR